MCITFGWRHVLWQEKKAARNLIASPQLHHLCFLILLLLIPPLLFSPLSHFPLLCHLLWSPKTSPICCFFSPLLLLLSSWCKQFGKTALTGGIAPGDNSSRLTGRPLRSPPVTTATGSREGRGMDGLCSGEQTSVSVVRGFYRLNRYRERRGDLYVWHGDRAESYTLYNESSGCQDNC